MSPEDRHAEATDPHACDLTTAFLAHDLGDRTFGHREHLYVAYNLLNQLDFIDASATYAKGIRAIAAKAGAHDKFNVTITYAFMSLVAEAMSDAPGVGFDEFLEQNPQLMSKTLLNGWYDNDVLNSDKARTIFLLPCQRS